MSLLILSLLLLVQSFGVNGDSKNHPETVTVATRIPTILDTDIGTDFDDCWALIYLLSRSDLFDLKLVQVSTYNTTKRGQIAAKILDVLNRTDVVLGIGDYTGEQGMPEYPWASNYSLNTYTDHGGKIVYGTAYFSQLMANSDPANPVFVVEIAPATSLGDVLLRNPSVAKNSVAVAMSGSVKLGYMNSSTPAAEYNVVQNVTSSQAMYNATWLSPLATAPLDTTNWEQWNGAVYQPIIAANNSDHPYVQVLLENYVVWYNNGGSGYGALQPFTPTTGTDCLYDAQAAYTAGFYGQSLQAKKFPFTTPNLVLQPFPLIVDNNGYTVSSDKQPYQTYAAIDFTSGLDNPYVSVGNIGTDIIQAIINAPLK